MLSWSRRITAYVRSLLVVSLAATSAGCSKDSAFAPVAPLSKTASTATPQTIDRLQIDAPLRALARRSPGSAAYYMESDGTVTVGILASASDADELAAAAWVNEEVLAQGFLNAAGKPVGTQVVRDPALSYSLQSLLDWRDAGEAEWFNVGQLSFVDLDERHGRIVIGMPDRAVEPTVRAIAETLGIPADALIMETKQLVRETSSPPSDVQQRSRPLAGGVQIGTAAGTCTLGIIALTESGTPVAFTNGHCSASEGSADFGALRQNNTLGSLWFGAEAHDAVYLCRDGGGPYYSCDHADFAYYILSGLDYTAPETPYELGLIWRLVQRWQGPSTPPIINLAVDQQYPRLVVTSTYSYPIYGQRVDHVGQTTGWSHGLVYKTCTTTTSVSLPSVKKHCQDWASYHSQGGDSGGPVFVHFPEIAPSEGGNGVVFMGLHWGSDAPNGGVFSSTRQIRNEIGNFRFW